MKRILITGAAGNVGRLIRPLLASRYRLRVTDVVGFQGEPTEEAVIGNLADPDFCENVIKDVDGVVHLAGLVAPDADFAVTFDPNYRAVLNLLEACKANQVERLVFASSHHVVGMLPSDAVHDEGALLAPDTFYGLSKAFGEAACSMYAHRFGIRTLLLRIGNADTKVVDGRRERLWTSGRDMVQLIEIGLEHPDVSCDVVYAVSRCPRALFRNAKAEQLGYTPLDTATDHRAEDFRDLRSLPLPHTNRVGGFFAAADLPAPEGKDSWKSFLAM